MKINKSIWFTGATTPQGSIGIVMTTNEMGEKKAYVGFGQGFNQQMDEEKIRDWGSKLLPDHLNIISNHINVDPEGTDKLSHAEYWETYMKPYFLQLAIDDEFPLDINSLDFDFETHGK